MTTSHFDLIDEVIADKKKIRDLEAMIIGLKIFIERAGLLPPKSYTTWVDPPSGWKYGFPKPLPKPAPTSIEKWLISEGYPERDAPIAARYSRWWNQPDDEIIPEDDE